MKGRNLRQSEMLQHSEEELVRFTLWGLSALCLAFCLLVFIYTLAH